MYHYHLILVHFAVALYVAAMLCEVLSLFAHKRFWALTAKYHLAAAAISAFAAMVTGFYDFRHTWMSDPGLFYMKTHMILGVVFFLLVQLQANYRFIIHKMLPQSAFTAYLVLGGLGLGLLFGTVSFGRTGVYQFGAGVNAVMVNRYETEEYLKRLYRLESLPDPNAGDSAFAKSVFGGEDTLYSHSDSIKEFDHDREDLKPTF